MNELLKFMEEQAKAGGLDKEISNRVKSLWNEYKEINIKEDCSILCADFGALGSIIIRDIISCEPEKLKYESGEYDYISIECNTKRLLWTDYSDVEPYNRQSGLYCGGMSFDMLGPPIFQCEEYREFQNKDKFQSNICFAVWGFDYNDFYNCVRFGICVKIEKVDSFLIKLRKIIGK